MRNLVPSRVLERRSRNLLQASILVILAGIFLIVVAIILFVFAFVVPSNSSYGLYEIARIIILVIGSLVTLVGFVFVIRALTWRTENNFAEYAGSALAQYYDDSYIFIRNVSKLTLGYIDAVMIGRPGVLVFRIIDNKGTFFNEGAKWMRQEDKGEWDVMRWSPTKEAIDDIHSLREFLSKKGLPDVPVYGVVLFIRENPDVQISVKNPVVPIVTLSEFSYSLNDNYFAKDRINQETINKLVQILYAT
jgi:hypothetical protein